MTIKFVINSRVEILEENEVYKSTIQDESSEYISLSLPIKDGVYMTPSVGQKLEVLYYEQLNVYKFEASVIGRKVENRVPQLLLSNPENVVKIQRRRFVRVDVAFYVKYIMIKNKKAQELVTEKEMINAILLDISGGGFKLKTTQKLQQKDIVLAKIPAEGEEISVVGEVVRVEKSVDNKYLCGISFLEIDERTRDKIIRFIFTLMRKQRKNS